MVEEKEDSLNVLMAAYRVYQDTQKHNEATTKVDTDTEPDDKSPQHLLQEAYRKYTCITRVNDSSADTPNLIDEALRFCQQHSAALRKAATTSSTTKAMTQSVTSSANHQDSIQKKPTAAVAPQKRRDEPTTANAADEKNGLNAKEQKTSEKPAPRAQITMVAVSSGKTYTKIAPPANHNRFAPSSGSAFQTISPRHGALRLDPGLRHLQDSSKKLCRSTSVPVTYPDGEENTPPHRRLLCRTGSCVSDSTKLKLKNSILARTSAALVRKPSITDQEMLQLRAPAGPGDYDSSDSEDDDVDEEVDDVTNRGRKRKYSDDAPPTVSTNDHPSLIPAHQSAVITTAEST